MIKIFTRIVFICLLPVLIFLTSHRTCAVGAGHEQPYVLLISFDGFRWDYLDRGLTPNINNFR